MARQRRLAYNGDFKLKAINHAKEHGNRSAAREYNINESMVRKWRKQEDDLRLAKKTKKSFHGNKPRWPQLEDRLDRWISKQRAAGRTFSTVAVRTKAMANEMGINDFKAGPSWCFHFMKRRPLSICTRTMVSQQLLVDYEEKLASFWSYCKSKISVRKTAIVQFFLYTFSVAKLGRRDRAPPGYNLLSGGNCIPGMLLSTDDITAPISEPGFCIIKKGVLQIWAAGLGGFDGFQAVMVYRRQQRLSGGNKSQQHADHQQGGTKYNRDHQKLYQGGQVPHSSGRTSHHGYSQNWRWYHNQKQLPNDKETHRNAKKTENLKIENTTICAVHISSEMHRGLEAMEKQSQQYIQESETKQKDSIHEHIGEGPKINLLQSSKDRLRRRLKEKEEVTVETTNPEKNKMDKIIEILNSMRKNSSDVDSKLTTFMEEAQNSTNSEEMLGEIVKTIYQKAVTDRSFASTAAKLCDKMALFMVEGTKFRSLLLNMLQTFNPPLSERKKEQKEDTKASLYRSRLSPMYTIHVEEVCMEHAISIRQFIGIDVNERRRTNSDSGVQAASEVIGTEAQLLLAPRLPVLEWMFKGKVPSTHHATDSTWSQWIALIMQRACIRNLNRPGILEIITNWPEGENFGLTDKEEQEQVSWAEEAPPYNQLPADESCYALFTDGSCCIAGMNRKWKAAIWSPTQQVAQATEREGGSSQLAELKAVQLALDIAEREKWPKLYLYTDS
ncbi:hypothetical protein TURU_105353 [Turdus rufiventris]|nr:hypothetical protein TURU_105353 [Turdus rufiventris]